MKVEIESEILEKLIRHFEKRDVNWPGDEQLLTEARLALHIPHRNREA